MSGEYFIKDAYIESNQSKSNYGNIKRSCIGIAGNKNESYIFNTRYTKSFNWNFFELEGTEIYKGENWENYDHDVLINILLNSSSINLTISHGFFGYDIIDYGECIH